MHHILLGFQRGVRDGDRTRAGQGARVGKCREDMHSGGAGARRVAHLHCGGEMDGRGQLELCGVVGLSFLGSWPCHFLISPHPPSCPGMSFNQTNKQSSSVVSGMLEHEKGFGIGVFASQILRYA